MNNYINTFLYPVSLTLLFAIASIVTFKKFEGIHKARVFLALMFWCYFYAIFIGYSETTGFISRFPHFFRTGHAVTLLFMPFSFLYVSRTLFPRKWQWKDYLHFLPLLLFLVDYSGFFAKTALEKRAIYLEAASTNGLSYLGEGYFFPKGLHVIIRYVLMATYWIMQARCIYIARAKLTENLSPNDAMMFRWLKWLAGTQLLIMTPPIINFIFPFQSIRILNHFSAMIGSFVQGYFLFFRPEILYGFSKLANQKTWEGEKKADGILPEFASKITDLSINSEEKEAKWMTEMANEIESYFKEEKPFTKPKYNLHDLGREMNLSPNRLSYCINHQFGMNFNAFINGYRINLIKQKLDAFEYTHKTLEGIAFESGFQNRATFINAFKEQTGLTPSAYIKELTPNAV
jgi:AraC-like DNA-binding protein